MNDCTKVFFSGLIGLRFTGRAMGENTAQAKLLFLHYIMLRFTLFSCTKVDFRIDDMRNIYIFFKFHRYVK